MDVIGHDQIITNEPRAGFVPRGNNRVMNICVRERLHPVSGAIGEEDDCGLATKDENTFCRMPASNMVAHIWLDGVSPYQSSAVWDNVARPEPDLQSHKQTTADSVGRRAAEPARPSSA